MIREEFDDCIELAEYMNYLINNGSESVTSVLFYDKAIVLIKELLQYEDVLINLLLIEPSEYNSYEDEYFITLVENKKTGYKELYVEAAKTESGYLITESDVLLVDEDASSGIVIKNSESECHEICVGDEYDSIDDEDLDGVKLYSKNYDEDLDGDDEFYNIEDSLDEGSRLVTMLLTIDKDTLRELL